MIDLLESRRLFTAVTIAEAALAADVTVVRADINVVVAAARTEVKAVAADLKALPKTAANKALLKTTAADEASVTKLITNGVKKILATESGKLKQLEVDALAVFKHPSNKGAQAKLKTLLTTVQGDVQAPLVALGISAYTGVTKVSADFSAIEIANPADTKLPADVSSYGSIVTTSLTKLGTDATTFQTDLTTLIAAV